jgi:3-oxoacyl-[acyl-carrier-protein] synthase III
MSLAILGTGWVTPLGRDLATVAAAIRSGATPLVQRIENPHSHREHPAFTVDHALLADSEKLRRLRRSSTISHLGVTAALDALADAGFDSTPPDRTALLFAASDGGVIYTRRFFAEIADRGTQAGSPLLFPETVYNAPASHIAATLGITGTSSTLVGDAIAGVSAVATAADLLATHQCDLAVVVAAEEVDWIICEAYGFWKMATRTDRLTPFANTGTIFAEGAAALVLARDGGARLDLGPTRVYRDQPSARSTLADLVADSHPDQIVASANGTRLDEIEASTFRSLFPNVPVLAPKASLGEAFSATTLAQIILATRQPGRTLVTTVGLNNQLNALTVSTQTARRA